MALRRLWLAVVRALPVARVPLREPVAVVIFTSVGIDTMHDFYNAPPIPWVVFVHRTGTNWCTLYAPYATATDARIVGGELHHKLSQEGTALPHRKRQKAAESGDKSANKRQKTGGQPRLFGEEIP